MVGVPKGYIQTEEHRIKRGIAIKGRTPWNKGKKLSELMRQNISKAKIGEKNPMFGKTHDLVVRIKLHNSHINKPCPWNLGNSYKKNKTLTSESINLIKKARAKQTFPKKDTKPERMMQIALALNNIKFQKHKLITNNKDFYHQVDIFIEPNICVEVDGDYWHKRVESIKRDLIINHNLNLLGFHVIRIWESDIKNNTQEQVLKIISLLKNSMGVMLK